MPRPYSEDSRWRAIRILSFYWNLVGISHTTFRQCRVRFYAIFWTTFVETAVFPTWWMNENDDYSIPTESDFTPRLLQFFFHDNSNLNRYTRYTLKRAWAKFHIPNVFVFI